MNQKIVDYEVTLMVYHPLVTTAADAQGGGEEDKSAASGDSHKRRSVAAADASASTRSEGHRAGFDSFMTA